MPSTISAGTTAGTAIAIAGDTTGNLAFQTNGTTTAMTIDTSQNVGIGISSPGQKLDVNGQVKFQASSSGRYFQFINDSSASYLDASHALNLRVNGASSLATAATLTTGGDFQFNSGYGSVATAYGCRAWVNFNGTGTPAIRASGGASSITDNGPGNYVVNLSITLPDTNYAFLFTCNWEDPGFAIGLASAPSNMTKSTTAVELYTVDSRQGNERDFSQVNAAIFR